MASHTDSTSDEVSLVDIAVVLIKRWKLMLAIFLLTMVAIVAFVLLRPANYVYTSLYSVAETADEQGDFIGLETPEIILIQMDNVILPAQIRAYVGDHDLQSLPFTVKAEHLEDTKLISLSTEAGEHQAENIEALHRQVLNAIATEQADLVERKRASLERRLSVIQKTINFAGVDIDEHPELISRIVGELAALHRGEIKQVAAPSMQPDDISAKLLLILGTLLAVGLAVMGVFFCHFCMAVRQRLDQT